MAQVNEGRANLVESGEGDESDQRAIRRRTAWKKYYDLHKDELRVKARERAAHARTRRLERETPEEAEARKQQHRLAAAKYREAHKLKIRYRTWKRRPENQAWIESQSDNSVDKNPDAFGAVIFGLFNLDLNKEW